MDLAFKDRFADTALSLKKSENYCIYIVLSHSSSVISKAIYLYTRDEYTHASISIDRNLEALYGFGRKWPRFPFIGCLRRELMDQGFYSLCKTVPGLILKFDVTEEQYRRIKRLLSFYVKNKDLFKYNFLGFIGYMFKTEIRSKKRFTCSEFVAHLLQSAQVVKFDKPLNLIRPQIFTELGGQIVYKGDLKSFFKNLEKNNSLIV